MEKTNRLPDSVTRYKVPGSSYNRVVLFDMKFPRNLKIFDVFSRGVLYCG